MSDKPKLLVSHVFTDEVEARIARDYAIAPGDRPVRGDDLPARAAESGAAAILSTPVLKLSADVIEALPENVKMIAQFAVGFDNIDTDAAKARGIVVTNTPDAVTEPTAEIAILCMLGAARRASEGERLVRADEWTGWSPTFMLGRSVTNKRLGIAGMGRIGQAIAALARGFGMEIHYWKRSRLPAGEEHGATYHKSIEALLPHCDYLSMNVAYNAETEGLLNAGRIALLPDGAILINTARGPVVDDDAVIAALKSGKLGAAGLDVFTGEPDIDPRYRALENTFLLPHLGTSTVEARTAMGNQALDNLDAFFAGKEPPDRIA